ncbi:MAG: histidine kinase [Actinobacteria bacterium]|jgi:signal transduction histidine kinase|nr:histidine kinase [Actinomycetota bacterium]
MGAAVVVFAAGLPVLIGVLVATRSPHRVVGLLLVAHGLSVAAVGIESSGALAGTSRLVADQLVQGFWVLLFAWLALAVYLLPDGRFPSGRWRTWVVTCAVGTGAFVLGAVGDAASFGADHPGVAPPLPTLPQPVSAVLGGGGLVAVGLLVAGAATWVARRLGHVEDDSRTRLLWLVWGAVAMPVSLVVGWLNRLVLGNISWLADSALAVGVLSVPLAIGVAILRHRLFDIRVVLSRTVTYSVMVGGVLLLYAALLEGVRRLGGDRTVGGLVAVAVVAVTVHPVFSRLRRRVDRKVYGYRSDPQRALRLLAQRSGSLPPEALTGAITEVVAEVMRISPVRIDDHASRDPGDLSVALQHRGQVLGYLVVRRPADRRLGEGELALLEDLARYAAVLVRADREHADVRISRSRIVTAREEERRRLRRDLHDGVGPSLAAVVLTLNAAESRTNTGERAALLAEARAEVREAIAEVRRIVDDLRPPALDEVGLLGAIRQRALRLSGDVVIDVHGPAVLPELPAAVESAAFRIASEAMTNVVRHSGARWCQVSVIVAGQDIEVIVSDDGQAPMDAQPGVGWQSMCDRAMELGGTCRFATDPKTGGLVVRALLPGRVPSPPPGERMVTA